MTLEPFAAPSGESPPSGIYVFVDGPSTDHTLGDILGHPPGPPDRPDWRRLEPYFRSTLQAPAYEAAFVVRNLLAEGFITFLQHTGFRVEVGVNFSPRSCSEKIEEMIGQLNAAASAETAWHLVVGTHDEPLIRSLPQLAASAASIGVFGFTERLPDDEVLDGLERPISVYDIEDDAKLFRRRLHERDEDGGAASVLEHATAPTAVTAEAPILQSQDLAPPPELPPNAAPLGSAEPPPSAGGGPRDCYFMVDGHNIDKELSDILGAKPTQETRPDWRLVLDYVRHLARSADGEVKALFAHIAPGHAGFRRAITELGFRSVPVQADAQQHQRLVVQDYLCRVLAARQLRGEEAPDAGSAAAPDVIVVGHSAELFTALSSLPDAGQRIAVLGFPEKMPQEGYYDRIQRLDIEKDTGAFKVELPRELGINVDNFDPNEELAKLF